MTDIQDALSSAADQNLISHQQAQTLAPFLQERLFSGRQGLDAPRDDSWSAVEETEAPRFVRGFHDILITIGVIIGLTGIWGITSFYGGFIAVFLLSEILVRRQRLALPAVVLAIAYTIFAAVTAGMLLPAQITQLGEALDRMLLMTVSIPVLLFPYYLRYRTPIALGILLIGIFASIFVAMVKLLDMVVGLEQMIDNHPMLFSSMAFVTALALFALAMRFDLSDRLRVTRRSDVAFWLHLVTAPALLGSTLSFIFLSALSDANLDTAPYGGQQPYLVIAIVACFMLIGVLIDRRAFVTSGLLSLGVSIGALLYSSDSTPDFFVFMTLLIVGTIVLVIGIGWQFFRSKALLLLPDSVRAKLPPAVRP